MSFGDKLSAFEPYLPFPYAEQVRLDANESGYDIPADIKQQMLYAISNVAFNRYPDPNAKDLCQAFAEYYGVSSDHVVAGNGSDELLSVIFGGILSEKDRVLVTAPDFSMYRIYCEIYGRQVFVYDKNSDLEPETEKLCRYIKENGITFFIFSNPCNPTGLQMPVADICRLLENPDCTVCVDEAYMDFSSGSVMDRVGKYDNLMVLKTMSKNIGFAAGRVGFAVSAKKNVDAVRKAKSPYNLNSMSQAAAAVLFRNGDYLRNLTAKIISLRQKLETGLKALESADFKVYSSNANFVYIKTDRAAEYYNALLEENIVVRCFGGKFLRISAGTEKENALLLEALQRIKA